MRYRMTVSTEIDAVTNGDPYHCQAPFYGRLDYSFRTQSATFTLICVIHGGFCINVRYGFNVITSKCITMPLK